MVIGKVIGIAEGRQPTRAPLTRSTAALDMERVTRALRDSFDVLKPVGSNGLVETYLARDRRGKSVLLKVLSVRAAADVYRRKLFYLEAGCASKLAQVNILASTGAEEALGVDYCIVEHIAEARPLGDLLDRNGWLAVEDAARIADQISSALDYAHQMGVVHLRLQPDCVLVDPDGWVTVSGFGAGAATGALRLQPPNVAYASPEVAMERMADHRSDLYSLGALLYEMLTDRTPFDSGDAEQIKRKQMSVSPAAPHLISPYVPESVSNLVMKLLERQPEDRFASAVQFQAALVEAVD